VGPREWNRRPRGTEGANTFGALATLPVQTAALLSRHRLSSPASLDERENLMSPTTDVDDDALDAASAHRVTTALRREQAARDDRPLARTWGHLADQIQRSYPLCEEDGQTAVTLGRVERDAIYREIDCELGGALGDLALFIGRGDGEKVRYMRVNAERAFRLLDDIGWDLLDVRETYPLRLPAGELATYARWRIEQTEGCLRVDAPSLATAASGVDPWQAYRPTMGGSVEEDVAQLRESVDRDLDVIAACRSILAQLGEEA
jgi:hypothetical protein